MPSQALNLRETVVLLYELEGISGVKNYSRENNIPLKVCLDLLITHMAGQLEDDLGGGRLSRRAPSAGRLKLRT